LNRRASFVVTTGGVNVAGAVATARAADFRLIFG
jgi:hypothetical protein